MRQPVDISNHPLGERVSIKRRRRRGERCVYGKIADKLGAAIVAGQYKPCDTLLGEIAFSGALNVSRGAYREAILMLSAKGLLESRPKMGTRVLPRERWNMLDPDVLGWALASQSPDSGFLHNLFELRRIVHPAAAALAAQHRDDDDLELLKSALVEMSRYPLASEEGRHADRKFHSAVLSASRNEFIVALTSRIGMAFDLTTIYKRRTRELPGNPALDHRRVYQAIADGNSEAARSAMLALTNLALTDTER